MASIDADATTAPSILQSDDHNRRSLSDTGGRASSLPAGEGGVGEPSPPQALPGGPATILWYNMGVTRQKELNSKGAVECYERAVEGGHAKAQHNLAVIYEKGAPGVPKDDFEAVRLFKLAADQGLAESCYSLAMHLKFGLGESAYRDLCQRRLQLMFCYSSYTLTRVVACNTLKFPASNHLTDQSGREPSRLLLLYKHI